MDILTYFYSSGMISCCLRLRDYQFLTPGERLGNVLPVASPQESSRFGLLRVGSES
ncbi:hypothetical protein COLO4_04409 [Corchorus olitorius]|uniref:Uncharacterized protein n=1 Tax=Corchorus olitorius TaxID=93759 RepID=A0A1R3KU45_9ROSI|nr:hypothetical protein COLO4_04409 [Corchorus olitorius]